MKNFLYAATAAATILLGSNFALGAETQDPGKHNRWKTMGRQINAVAMNVIDPAFVLPKNATKGYSIMLLHVFFDHAADGVLTMTCRSLDNSRSPLRQYIPTTCDVADGVCSLKGLTGATLGGSWVTDAALTADRYFSIPVNITGYHDIRCAFNHGGTPTANDKISVDAYLSTH